MTIEERKKRLINWISNLKSETVIDRMEQIKRGSSNEIPDEILTLLDTSNATKKSDLIEHTNSRTLFQNR